MNRVLVIAYYTPPLGFSGVMRVTKLCKFLPHFGWEPVLLTVKPVAYYGYDPDLLEDLKRSFIIRTETLDLNRVVEIVRGFLKGKRQNGPEKKKRPIGFPASKMARLLNFVFLPDAKVGWLPFALGTGKRAIGELKPDVIFATAPPWTGLVAGEILARNLGLPLIADFRDPWPTGFQKPPFYQRGMLKKILRGIVQQAAMVLVVNHGTKERLTQSLGRMVNLDSKLQILENGFDPDEFEVEPERLEGVSLLYAGNLYENRQELTKLLFALNKLPEAKFYLAGKVDPKSQQLLENNRQVVILGPLPHSRVCALMKGANALVYLGKPDQPVGLKLYEYLGAQKPIIVWGNEDEEAAKLVEELGAGVVVYSYEQLGPAVAEILNNPERFTRSDRSRFNRRFQAQWLANMLSTIKSSAPEIG